MRNRFLIGWNHLCFDKAPFSETKFSFDIFGIILIWGFYGRCGNLIWFEIGRALRILYAKEGFLDEHKKRLSFYLFRKWHWSFA